MPHPRCGTDTMLRIRKLLVVLAGVAMLVGVALAYAPAKDAALVWDDHVLVAKGASTFKAPITKILFGAFWPETPLADARAPYYRPLVILTFLADHARGGTPADFHLTNVVLHLLGCVFLAIAARRLGARPLAAIAAALLWGLAPRLTESVVWIAGRTDLLAGTLGLAALALAPDVGAAPGRRAVPVRAAVAAVCLLGAMLSKEVGVAFALAIVLGTLRRSRDRATILRLAGYVGVPVAVWASARQIALAGKDVHLRDLGAGRRAATVLEALARYVEMTLDALHPRTCIGMLGEVDGARAALGGVLAIALVALLVRYRRASPAMVASCTLSIVSLGLVLHVVPFTLAGSVAADRLLYAPLAGLAIGGAVVVSAASTNVRRAAGILALGLAILFAQATRRRAAEYGDELGFWITAAENAHPHNTMPVSLLAGLVNDADDVALACQLYERSTRILEASERAGLAAHRRARENLAACWGRSGRYADALRISNALAHDYPDAARVQLGLAFARLHMRDFDGAIAAFERTRALDRALASDVSTLLVDVQTAHQEWSRFQSTAERSAAPLAWANHLARVGRRPEATAAFLAVALSSSRSELERRSAIDFLVLEGELDAAERALATPDTSAWAAAMRARLAERQARHARLLAVRPAIAQLAAAP